MAKQTAVKLLPQEAVLHVRDTCLCLAAQRAARRLARRFDLALKPLKLTNGQFSLLMALNQPEPPPMGRLADFLAMEPSTLTSAVKVLEQRGLLLVERDPKDSRSKRLRITPEGVALMRKAVTVWRKTHAQLEAALPPGSDAALREGLTDLAAIALSTETPPSPPSDR